MTIDALEQQTVARLGDDEIEALLRECDVGVLGLQTGGAPYLLPLSYGYDGDRGCYFAFLGDEESRKRTLAERDAPASFLVYDVRAAHEWRSALLTGDLETVPADDWDEALATTDDAWRPPTLEAGQYHTDVNCYRLGVDEWDGIQQRTVEE